MTIRLNQHEIALLDRQRPATRSRGGFQSLIVDLAFRVNRSTGLLTLTRRDLERIPRYAFDYGNGGWENRLRHVFERSFGPALGRTSRAA
jgi:hypothetical protein